MSEITSSCTGPLAFRLTSPAGAWCVHCARQCPHLLAPCRPLSTSALPAPRRRRCRSLAHSADHTRGNAAHDRGAFRLPRPRGPDSNPLSSPRWPPRDSPSANVLGRRCHSPVSPPQVPDEHAAADRAEPKDDGLRYVTHRDDPEQLGRVRCCIPGLVEPGRLGLHESYLKSALHLPYSRTWTSGRTFFNQRRNLDRSSRERTDTQRRPLSRNKCA